jgi:hypothetical protein
MTPPRCHEKIELNGVQQRLQLPSCLGAVRHSVPLLIIKSFMSKLIYRGRYYRQSNLH